MRKTNGLRITCLFSVLLLCECVCSTVCFAQLFGPRTIRRNTRSRGLQSAADPGTPPAGDRRFIRGNRDASNFVGADRGEAANFVGNTQAINDGTTTTAVEGLREQTEARVNRARQRLTTGIYAERLSIGFEIPPRSSRTRNSSRPRTQNQTAATRPQTNRSNTTAQGNSRTNQRFATLNKIADERGYEVRAAENGNSVTLSGTVATKRQRDIAAILAMFEPGVDSVKNELQVRASNSD